jgi:signal peptidase I
MENATLTITPRPYLRRRSLGRLLREILDTVILVAVMYTLVNLFTARFVVEGDSMQPNFETGQFLIVSRANYLFGALERGDIVVFHYPAAPREDYIKRLIGLPGDVVEIRDAQVYVNGELLNEPYINEPCTPQNCQDERWEVGENHYFLMGDNRNHSSDSRGFGPVSREFIVGEAIVRYFPLSDIGVVTHIGYPG